MPGCFSGVAGSPDVSTPREPPTDHDVLGRSVPSLPMLEALAELLDRVDARLAGLASRSLLAEAQEREWHALERVVADVAAELLGADHPLVAQLRQPR
jgi:hypothetical protein